MWHPGQDPETKRMLCKNLRKFNKVQTIYNVYQFINYNKYTILM